MRRNTISPTLRRIAQRYPDVVGAALRVEAEVETTEVKKRTPIQYGPLRASVHAEGPFRNGRSIYASIVAGGASALYAIIVHENPDAWHAPPTQWKFIESVIMESRQWMGARVARRAQLREAM